MYCFPTAMRHITPPPGSPDERAWVFVYEEGSEDCGRPILRNVCASWLVWSVEFSPGREGMLPLRDWPVVWVVFQHMTYSAHYTLKAHEFFLSRGKSTIKGSR